MLFGPNLAEAASGNRKEGDMAVTPNVGLEEAGAEQALAERALASFEPAVAAARAVVSPAATWEEAP